MVSVRCRSQYAMSPHNKSPSTECEHNLECEIELKRELELLGRIEKASEDPTAEISSNKKRKAPGETTKYNIVQVATRPDDREQTKKALANKSLGLCVANYDGGSSFSYLILLTEADDLFDEQPRFEKIQVQFPGDSGSKKKKKNPVDSKAGDWFGMGCAISGTALYLVGGQKIENTSSDSSSDSDSCDYSSKVFRVRLPRPRKFHQTDMECETDIECEEASPMLSEIASPLIIPVGKKLYMLAGPPLSMLPDYPFQVYDPEKDKYPGTDLDKDSTKPWEELETPLFLNLDSKYFQDPRIRSYVVFDNKIHVSTSSFSFTFDTDEKKWYRCTLFDDPRVQRWIEIQNPTEYGWMIYPPNSNKEYCGRPFEFDGRAVNFELKPHRIIICLALFPSREVVAYKFVDGEAPDKQVLLKEKELDIPPDATAYLADFQNGYLCLLTVSNDHQPTQGCQISITPLKVSKLVEYAMSPGNFLKCTPSKKIDRPLLSPAEQSSSSKIWTPIGSFVVDVEH